MHGVELTISCQLHLQAANGSLLRSPERHADRAQQKGERGEPQRREQTSFNLTASAPSLDRKYPLHRPGDLHLASRLLRVVISRAGPVQQRDPRGFFMRRRASCSRPSSSLETA